MTPPINRSVLSLPFADIAVGAPFLESGGKVFIYLGSADGLKKTPSQVMKSLTSGVFLTRKCKLFFGSACCVLPSSSCSSLIFQSL